MNCYTKLGFNLLLPKDMNLKYLKVILPSCIILFSVLNLNLLNTIFLVWRFSFVKKAIQILRQSEIMWESFQDYNPVCLLRCSSQERFLSSIATHNCFFKVGFYPCWVQCQRAGQSHLFHRLSGKCKVKLPLLTLASPWTQVHLSQVRGY